MGRSCEVEGCGRTHYALGYCDTHYRRKRAGRSLDKPLATRSPRAPDPAREYTGRFVDAKGYVRIYRPGHPNAHANGWMYEHTYVMHKVLERPLYRDEHVHHRNGVRDDNRRANLELWASIPQPAGQRASDLADWAETILGRYRPWRLR